MRKLLLTTTALVAFLSVTEGAEAGFLVAPVAGAIAGAIGLGAIGTQVLTLVGTVALSVGLSAILRPRQKETGGVELDIRLDPLTPQSVLVGRVVTAGSRAYLESYGNNNQNAIEIIALADHPCEGLVTAYVEDQAASLTDTGGARGFTVDGYDSDLAIQFFDGTQSNADSYTVSFLGGHAERPWTSNHIGYDRTYARIHYVYNKEKVPQPLPWKFVIDGIKLYDPRLDTTVGGSGTHRWDDLGTHEFTQNLAVIAYNILRGIRIEDSGSDIVHLYGLQNTPAENLPLDNWFAAMNEADVEIALDVGGTEPQFHGGIEIPVRRQPLDVIKDIIKATGGRFVEIGGVYKLYLGEPGLPLKAFTDEDVVANKPEEFEPVTRLEEKVTYIDGSYISPDDDWIVKAAPPRLDLDQETEIGRRVWAEIDAPMVQSGTHMQRIMQQVLNRSIQQRRHTVPLPPEFFGFEPGDVLEWTSTRNGYIDKLFEIEGADIDDNLISVFYLREIDPDDYDWTTTDEIAESIGSLVQDRPAAKVIGGFTATGFLHEGDTGTKRPAIKLFWTPPDDDDVTGVAIQLRRAADPTEISNMSIDDNDGVEAGEAILLNGLAPETDYEVRARFKSFEGYGTEWSLWIPVTTPAAGVTAAELDASLSSLIDQLRVETEAALATRLDELEAEIEALAAANNGQYAIIDKDTNSIFQAVGHRVGVNEASVTTLSLAQSTTNSALAAFLLNLFATTEVGEANLLMRFVASSAPAGVAASVAIEARADTDEDFAFAGFYLDVGVTELGGRSRIRMIADQITFANEAGSTFVAPLAIEESVVRITEAIISGAYIEDLTVENLKLADGSVLNPGYSQYNSFSSGALVFGGAGSVGPSSASGSAVLERTWTDRITAVLFNVDCPVTLNRSSGAGSVTSWGLTITVQYKLTSSGTWITAREFVALGTTHVTGTLYEFTVPGILESLPEGVGHWRMQFEFAFSVSAACTYTLTFVQPKLTVFLPTV